MAVGFAAPEMNDGCAYMTYAEAIPFAFVATAPKKQRSSAYGCSCEICALLQLDLTVNDIGSYDADRRKGSA